MPVEDHPDASSHFVERRSKMRFPLGLRVSYRTLGQGSPRSGKGWVLNMSRSAVLVSAAQDVNMGKRVELSIEWPSLLYGRIPLCLRTVGEVVRCDASSFAIELVRYQFRTTKRKVIPIDTPAQCRKD
jgi:hypothetical protein